ncbi:MAG: class I adenylate cyclase [Succinivibrionaceae bacterium]|nr:class I adenylate cyclase [Succinivibrionaceae bacterium]
MQEPGPLENIIQRYDRTTEARARRAVAGMTPGARHFFSIIPVLLEYNHPILPGFIPGNTPHGICNFTLSAYQQEYLDGMCNVANCYIRSHIENPAIISLYCMGSTSSVGQSAESDIDIWVCHSHLMERQDVKKLEQKCGVLSNVAQSQGVEVNFFLVPDNKFRCGNTASVDKDNCGSALHLLLLEEFYRSSLWMAGKRLVWYLVTDEHDRNSRDYDAYVSSLFASGLISHERWFDLGPINDIPVQEFFGSAMWLLYKGVDSPFKAVLKIMLMEVYASEYPDVRLIANRIRRRMQQDDEYSLAMDSYFTVYELITEYLKKIKDPDRLRVVQACFLTKITKGVDENDKSAFMQWRLNLMRDLVSRCNLGRRTVEHLRANSLWRIDDVRRAYHEVTKVMLLSSNRLRSFSNRVQKLGSPIDITDFQILTQKLSSAFERKLDKVMKVNLNIAPNLMEHDISLVYVAPGKLNRSGWYLYPARLEPVELVKNHCVYFHKNVVNVLTWSILNGVLTSSTSIHISRNAPQDLKESIPLVARDLLEQCRLLSDLKTANRDLIGPMYFRRLLLLVNVSADRSQDSDKNELNLSNIDVMSFGGEKKSLFNSLDLLFANSWGEIYVKHYDQDEIVSGLAEMLNIRRPGTSVSRRPDFGVFCYSRYLSGIIRQQVSDLVGELLLLAHSTGEENSSLVFMMGQISYSALRSNRSVTITPLHDSLEFVRSINAMQQQMENERQSSPSVEKIYQYACRGVVQFFFQESDGACLVYVLDENNHLNSFRNSQQTSAELVDSISRRYTQSVMPEAGARTVRFAAPQFYRITGSEDQILIENYSVRKL